MNYSMFRGMVGGVVGVFEEFIVSGTSHRSPRSGRMFRIKFRRADILEGNSWGRVLSCHLFMRDDKLAVCHIDDFSIVDRNLAMTWFDLGDPELCDKVRHRLKHYLRF